MNGIIDTIKIDNDTEVSILGATLTNHGSDQYSIAFGKSAEAVGKESFAISSGEASGDYSFAEGSETQAGIRGFKICLSGNGEVLVYQSQTGESADEYYEVGDILQFDASQHYYNLFIITSTKKEGPYSSIKFSYPSDRTDLNFETDKNPDENYVWVANKQACGDLFPMAKASHSEGETSNAFGRASHAEGRDTKAIGGYSHAEGRLTEAGYAAHAEGYNTKANGHWSHAEGKDTTASGIASHVEGEGTTASNTASHAEGYGSGAEGNYSHAEGNGTVASGEQAHAEGYDTEAIGNESHAEGSATQALGGSTHAEGNHTCAYKFGSHAEGRYTIAKGFYSHAEGKSTYAGAVPPGKEEDAKKETLNGNNEWQDCAHAEGNGSIAAGRGAHAEGSYFYIARKDDPITCYSYSKDNSNVEDNEVDGLWKYQIGDIYDTPFYVEEYDMIYQLGYNDGLPSGRIIKVEDSQNNPKDWGKQLTDGDYVYLDTKLKTVTNEKGDIYSFGELRKPTQALGVGAHAEGIGSRALADAAHAGGLGTIASVEAQTAIGKYNAKVDDALFIVGNGTASTPSNAFIVKNDGTVIAKGKELTADTIIDNTIQDFKVSDDFIKENKNEQGTVINTTVERSQTTTFTYEYKGGGKQYLNPPLSKIIDASNLKNTEILQGTSVAANEYATTERWLGYPVYQAVIKLKGNTDYIDIPWTGNINDIYTAIDSFGLVASSSGLTRNMPYEYWHIWGESYPTHNGVSGRNHCLRIRQNKNNGASGYTIIFTVKYIKVSPKIIFGLD